MMDSDSDLELSYEEMRPFQCDKCTNRFIKQKDLEFHTKLVHAKGIYQCAKCDYSCRGIGQMTVHNRKHISDSRHSNKTSAVPNGKLNKGLVNRSTHGVGNVRTEKKREESDKENEHSRSDVYRNSDDSDDNKVSENRKQSKSESSNENKRQNDLDDNVSRGEQSQRINIKEKKVKKIQSDKNKGKVQSKYNVGSSESDNNSDSDDEKINNEKKEIFTKASDCNKEETSSREENNVTSQEPKKKKFTINLNEVRMLMKSSKLSTNLGEDKNEVDDKNLDINLQRSIKSKRLNSQHTASDSENENRNKEMKTIDKSKSDISNSDKPKKIKDKDKFSYERRKSINESDSESENKLKQKSKYKRNGTDSESENKDRCKSSFEKHKSKSNKSKENNSYNKENSSETRLTHKSEGETEKRIKDKSKSKKHRSDSENENRKSNSSISEQKSRYDKKSSFEISSTCSSESENEIRSRNKATSEKRQSSSGHIENKDREKLSSSSKKLKSHHSNNSNVTNESVVKLLTNAEKSSNREINENEQEIDVMNSLNKPESIHLVGSEGGNIANKRKNEDESSKTLMKKTKILNKSSSDLEFNQSNDTHTVNVLYQGEKSDEDLSSIDKLDQQNKAIYEKNAHKHIPDQTENEIKKEVIDMDELNGKLETFKRHLKKTLTPMCKIPKENVKGIISEKKISNENENCVKKSKMEETKQVNQQTESDTDRDHHKYTCRVCNKTFERKKTWKIHLISGDCFSKGTEPLEMKQRTHGYVNQPLNSKDISNIQGRSNDVNNKANQTNANLKKSTKSVYATTKVEELMAKVQEIDNQFQCPECLKLLKTVGTMRRHLVIHTGEMPFQCTKCDSAFYQKIGLQQHLKKVHDEGMFRCKFCDENFVQEIHMKRHMSEHTGENPFSCTICKENFSLERDFKKHMRVNHESSEESNSIHNRNLTVPAKVSDSEQNTDTEENTNSAPSNKLNDKKDDQSECPKCSKLCKDATALKKHMRKKHQHDKGSKSSHNINEIGSATITKIQVHKELKVSPYRMLELDTSYSNELDNDSRKLIKEAISSKKISKTLNSHESSINVTSDDFSRKLDSSKSLTDSLSKSPTKSPDKSKLSLKPKLHKCPHCFETFRHKTQMISHMETHQVDSDSDNDSLPDINI